MLSRVRIIGGQWRSRLIEFQAVKPLRPTADRIRETLFNWLMQDIRGAVCLDLFAGSGALGFEALSRGAKQVVMCEQVPQVVAYLKKNAESLGITYRQIVPSSTVDVHTCTEPLVIYQGKFPQVTEAFSRDRQFDILFLDPPFTVPALLIESVEWLERSALLKEGALIYIEAAASTALPIPDTWTSRHHKKTKHIQYGLYRNI